MTGLTPLQLHASQTRPRSREGDQMTAESMRGRKKNFSPRYLTSDGLPGQCVWEA